MPNIPVAAQRIAALGGDARASWRRFITPKGPSQRPRKLIWQQSLRARLALWSGVLLALILILFGITVYVLTASAVEDSVATTVRAEARVAMADLDRVLLSAPPYWPAQLSLASIDAYSEPGASVEVRGLQGHVRYRSDADAPSNMISLAPEVMAAVRSGKPTWYTTSVQGHLMRVEALPIRPPSNGTSSQPIIGVLLVGKSLTDANTTLAVLRTLLIVGGVLAVSGALAGAWLIANRILRPLGEVAATASTITAATASGTHFGGLGQRVQRPGGDDELAHLVDAFNAMLTALQGANATQQRFIADASHELRAPLTTVQGNLALLLGHEAEIAPDERRAMLADAQAETLRLVQLVNDLLALARADAKGESGPGALGSTHAVGRDRPGTSGAFARPPLVDLDRVILDQVRQMRARLAAEESRLRLTIARVDPIRIRGDESEMRQLVLILLDNAVKYTPADQQGAAVTVWLERHGDQACLRVQDTGIGIDAQDLPHIFERFYRSDRARDRHGTGLGLSIAHTLVEQHGGTISVESTPGVGTTFTVQIPVSAVA